MIYVCLNFILLNFQILMKIKWIVTKINHTENQQKRYKAIKTIQI